MAAENPSLLIKKLIAMAALILGFLFLLLGVWYESPVVLLIGVLALALGIGVWALKIVRRNRPNPPE